MNRKSPAVNVHVYPSPMIAESRILKETKSLEDAGLFRRIYIFGTGSAGRPRVEALSPRRRIVRFGSSRKRPRTAAGRAIRQIGWSAQILFHSIRVRPQVINAHSVAVLPVCWLVARLVGSKLVYDAHELETETTASRGIQRVIFKRIESALIHGCDLVILVSRSIADWYIARYPGLDRAMVVRNVPDSSSQTYPGIDVRALLQVPNDARLYVHVGNIVAGRHIPDILAAFASSSGADHVVFLGGGVLEADVARAAASSDRIHHVPTLPHEQVVGFLRGCDIGLCLIEPTCLSYAMSLPNKALEYMEAGLPFLRTELPEVESLLEVQGGGSALWVVSDPSRDLGARLTTIGGAQIREEVERVHAVSVPSWSAESGVMVTAYRDMLSASAAS